MYLPAEGLDIELPIFTKKLFVDGINPSNSEYETYED